MSRISARLVFDEGPAVGLGHRRRMEALGRALADRGADVVLHRTGGPTEPSDLLVVDSYEIDASRDASSSRLTAAVDDLDRDLDVDVLVDPSPGISQASRRRCSTLLMGERFALLGPTTTARKPITDAVSIVVVSFGASGAAERALAVGGHLVARTGWRVLVVVGPWSQEPELEHDRIEVIRGRRDLDVVLGQSDIVITAGGVTMLEALRLGRPVVAVPIADNQRRAVEAAAAAGAVLVANAEDAGAVAVRLATDLPARRSMAAAGARLIDGRGADRVAKALLDAAA